MKKEQGEDLRGIFRKKKANKRGIGTEIDNGERGRREDNVMETNM